MNKYLWIMVLACFMSLPLVFAQNTYSDCTKYGNCKPTVSGTNFNNATAYVNDTSHFGGYTPATFVTYIQSLFDSVYCKLTGCSMTGNLTNTKDITAQYFYGDGSRLSGISAGSSGGSFNLIQNSPDGISNASVIIVPANLTISGIHIQCVGGTNVSGMVDVYYPNGTQKESLTSDVWVVANNMTDVTLSSNYAVNKSYMIGWHTSQVNDYPDRVLISVDYIRL